MFALWNVVVDGMITSRGALARTFLFIAVVMLPIGLVNWLPDTNYIYLCTPPEVDNPLVIGGWPWYIANVLIIGLVLMLITSIPMQLLRRRNAR